MSKRVTLTLTEEEYTQLLQQYLLGNIIHEEVNEPNDAQTMLNEALINTYCKAGFEAKVKGFNKLQADVYSFPLAMEDVMLDTQANYIQYIESGEREEEMNALKNQIDEMRKQGLL